VLRYDLFGRGFSDRPHTRYNIKLFTNQLAEIADHFSPNEPVVVCGLSMGGPITTSFLAQHPKRVAKHILIDPSGARAIDQTALLRAAKLPIVAELFYSLFGTDHLVNSLAKDFYDPKLVDDLKQHYRVQMQYKGYKRAILSTIRNNMLGDFIDSYRKAGKHKKPTLLLWGKDDTTIPLDHSTDICRAIPHTQIYIIEGCGHLPHYEKPEFVNPLILNFIKESQ
jgi:pimeloyl-ACP methyl ester carboxylesterase